MRVQVIPRARRTWVVTMKLTAVKIDETPITKMPITIDVTAVLVRVL